MANSVERDLDRADTLYKQAGRMQKRNPNAAKSLRRKAQTIENKAVARVGRKVRNRGVSTSKSGGRTSTLNFG